MSVQVKFDPQAFWPLVGARPVLETPRLNLHSQDEAKSFLKAYGYDVDVEADREKLWMIHSRAVTYLKSHILQEGETIPEDVADQRRLQDICHLLLWASMQDSAPDSLGKWACAVLRVMHVVAHLQNDLFNYFSSEIQEEIFRPYRNVIQEDGVAGIRLVGAEDGDVVRLKKFEMKPFKDSNSSITKLLAKPEEVAFGLLDKIGVRFVTGNLFDCFRVMQFLVQNHVVSYPHVIANQTNNTLYPVDLFLDVMESLPQTVDLEPADLDRLLTERLAKDMDRAKFVRKPNAFTDKDYRFIKFINRQLVRVTVPESQKSFTFFYPYEVQIIDYEHYMKSMQGEASHDEYKERQRLRARERVFALSYAKRQC